MSIGNVRVKVKRDELLKILHINLEAHKKAHQEAVKGWELEVVSACEQLIATAEEGKLKDLKPIFKHGARPASHAKEYERVSAMLRHHTEEDIELDERNFDQYVNDNWEWKEQWSTSNAGYRSR